MKAPTVMLKQANSDTNAKADCQSCSQGDATRRRRYVETGIGWDGCAIDCPRIVIGYIDHIRIGRLDHDLAAVIVDSFVLNGAKRSGFLGLQAHGLHGIHYVSRLIVVSVSQGAGPIYISSEVIEHARKRG
jgi:hypothetical protein